MIISLWVPDTLENGTESSAVLDCVYNYTEQVLKYWTITISAVLDCIYNYTEQVNISWDWTFSNIERILKWYTVLTGEETVMK